MRKLPVLSGAFIAAALVVAACGGTTTPTIPPVNVPSLPAIPSIAIPSISIGSFAIPSFAIPSFTGDPALAARFPTAVGASPVTNVQTFNYVAFLTAFTGSDPAALAQEQQVVAILQNAGINPATFAIGTADVTIDNNGQHITAFHTPGASGAALMAVLPQLAAITGRAETLPTVAQANVGGKTVTTVDDGSGSIDYFYPSGDVVWAASTDDPTVAAAILAATQ